MSEADLGKLEKSKIIFNLLDTLDRTSVELGLEDLEDDDLVMINKILGLITKATDISDYFTKLIKSDEHKFSEQELRKLTPITKISNKLKRLIKSGEKILEKKEEIKKIVVPLRMSISRSNIGRDLFYYEERFTWDREFELSNILKRR